MQQRLFTQVKPVVQSPVVVQPEPAVPVDTHVFETESTSRSGISVDPAETVPLFVIAHLECPFTRKEILRKSKRAINQAIINQQDVRSLTFLKPSKESQLRFAAIVDLGRRLCRDGPAADG